MDFYRTKCGHWKRILEGEGGEPFYLSDLSAREIDRFIDQRREEGASENTISKELITLRASLKLAKRRGLWRGDFDEIFPSGFSPRYKPRQRYLTGEELQLLLLELPPDRAARVAFIVATSASWGPTERVLRRDIASDRSVVLIRGTSRESREAYVVHATYQGSRWVVSCYQLDNSRNNFVPVAYLPVSYAIGRFDGRGGVSWEKSFVSTTHRESLKYVRIQRADGFQFYPFRPEEQ